MQPRLEMLEDRITPSVFTPTTFADDGSTNSLRGVLTQANNDTGTATDIIQLGAGTYTLSIANTSGHETAGKQGDLNITSSKHALVIQGITDASGNPTTIIQQTTLDRVFQIVNAGTSVTFKDLVIKGGAAQDDGGAGTAAGSTDAKGGGILDDGGKVTLSNVVLQSNAAQGGNGFSAEGGGIYASKGSLTINSSVIQLNFVSGGGATASTATAGSALGGGVYATASPTTIRHSSLSDNVLIGGIGGNGGWAEGGGILARDPSSGTSSTLTISDSTLSDNTLTGGNGTSNAGGNTDGGGIWIATTGPATISNSTLSGNILTGGNGQDGGYAYGGSISAGGFGLTTISNSTLSGNLLTGGNGGGIGGSAKGGGIYAVISTAISASTLSGNTLKGGNASGSFAEPGSANGGGGYFAGIGSPNNKLVNATVAGNQVIGYKGDGASESIAGGGLFFQVTTDTLTNVTVADNTASLAPGGSGPTQGGGINDLGGTVTLVNTLVASNSATTGPDYSGAVSNSDHNLIGKADGSSGFSAAHGDLLGSTAIPLDPQLGPLANNFGPSAGAPSSQQVVQTMALLTSSPALNAGDNNAQSVTGPYDQRGPGFARVVNGTIDIGAFEIQPPSLSGYSIEDLGNGSVTAINALGQVVGTAPVNGKNHASFWDRGQTTGQDLGALDGTLSSATAINDLGEIVGDIDPGFSTEHPFDLKPGGTMTDLNSLLPQSLQQIDDKIDTADGVTDTGVIVGQGSFNVIDGFQTSPYSFDPASGTFNQLDASGAIGEATAVAGTRAVANLDTKDAVGNLTSQAVVEDINTPRSSVNLPGIANQKQSFVLALSAPNASGTQFAVGYAFDSSNAIHAVLWTIPADAHSATVLDLGSNILGGSGAKALAVNAEGDVVGKVTEGFDSFAFVRYADGTVMRLDSLLPPNSGISLTSATGINDAGQISADGLVNGQDHAFRLTPILATPPQVTLTSHPDINSSGDTTYSFTVTYSDDNGIDASTLKNAIQVSGPGGVTGFPQIASLTSTSGKPTQFTATYQITAPGGTWDFTDDGTYTIILSANVAKTTSGQPLTDHNTPLGNFVAAINVQRGSIAGAVYNDVNANGQRDGGEGGLPNTNVFLDLNDDGTFDGGDRITQTDANGAYSFAGLLPGNYNVMVYTTGSSLQTIDPSNNIRIVSVGEGQNLTGVNFGVWTMPQITDIAGQNLVTTHGKTAQFDQPATILHITGVGFDPGDIFYFGNDQAFAGPKNFSGGTNLQSFDLQVPEFATTGPLVVFDARSNRFTTVLPNFTVDSYRNVNGYSFGNITGLSTSDYSWNELQTVYGSNQTDVDVFGIDTGIPDPLAYLEYLAINAAWCPPANGLCLGFSLSSARLSLGLDPSYSLSGLPDNIGDLPAADTGVDTATTVWQLANSPDLLELIRLAHLEQTSAEFVHAYLGQIIENVASGAVGQGEAPLINIVKSELAKGLPVLICLSEGGTSGHCVLAYNVQDESNGGEVLDIYDPNNPFSSFEDYVNPSSIVKVAGIEDGTYHADKVLQSTITIDSNGHWTYNAPSDGDPTKPAASGGVGGIAAIPLSTFDSDTLLASFSGLFTVLLGFGSATETQVTDSSGHTLLGADGSLNTNPNTMIPNSARFVGDVGATPLDLIEGTGNFMQTLTGTGSGTYGASSLSTDAMATLSDESTAKGQTDQFGLDPTNDKLTFTPGTTKNLNADLAINAADGTMYEAQVSSNAVGGTQTLQFKGNQVEFEVAKDSGGDTHPTESISLNFGHVNPAAMTTQSFSTGRLSLLAGDTVDVLPSDWNDLQASTATVTITHADGTKTISTITNGGQAYLVNAREGVATPSAVVARFSNQTVTGKSAVINWGDGTTSTGTVAASGADVTVAGSHTYAQQGYYTTHITLSDANGEIAQAAGEAIVTDTKFTLATANISAFAGVPFTGTVATLTDIPSGDVSSDFDVQINWGDGTTSTGTLQQTAAGKFDVRGSHTWATTGTKAVLITVTENGSTSGQGQTLAITSNPNFSGTVAQLQLPIPGSAPSDYVATIDWGDGATSTGTLTLQADGSVILSGSHSYATGNKSYVTHFTLTGGPQANTKSAAHVNPAVGTVTGTLFNDSNGNGTMDPGEAGLAGQTVFLDKNNNGKLDPGELSAVTDSSGVYTLTNVPAGSIYVSESVPLGARIAAPSAGSYTVTLNAGQTLANLNFANTSLALISGTVFVDANGNGKQDASEPGRANQIVYLDLNNDGVQEPTEPAAITDATGAFAFTVNAGSYVVRLQPFSNFTITTPANGAYNVTVGTGSTDGSGLFGEKLLVTSPPPPPPPPPASPPHSPPSPKAPPTLHTPPLLAFIDSLLGAIEKINSNDTETVTDSIFGIPLFVSIYDGNGDLTSVTIFGINITFLFE